MSAAARTLARSTSFAGKSQRKIKPTLVVPTPAASPLVDHDDAARALLEQGRLTKERAAALESRMMDAVEEEDPAFAAEVEAEEKAKELQVQIEQVQQELAQADADVAEDQASSEPSPKRAKTAEKGEYHYETIYTRAYALGSTGCLNEVYVPKKTRVYGRVVLGRCMGLAEYAQPPTPKPDTDLM